MCHLLSFPSQDSLLYLYTYPSLCFFSIHPDGTLVPQREFQGKVWEPFNRPPQHKPQTSFKLISIRRELSPLKKNRKQNLRHQPCPDAQHLHPNAHSATSAAGRCRQGWGRCVALMTWSPWARHASPPLLSRLVILILPTLATSEFRWLWGTDGPWTSQMCHNSFWSCGCYWLVGELRTSWNDFESSCAKKP